MPLTMSLTRRNVQLRLLELACLESAPARIRLHRNGDEDDAAATRLLAMEDDCVWLRWPHGALSHSDDVGETVCVVFTLEGQSFGFSAEFIERCEHSFGVLGSMPALKLKLPLRIERCERRECLRVNLRHSDNVVASLTHTTDPSRRVEMQLTDLSDGGLGGVINRDMTRKVGPRDLYRAEFTLGERGGKIDFIIRLVHMRPAEKLDGVMTGWAFCPGDDDLRQRENLRRLQEFVEQQRAEHA